MLWSVSGRGCQFHGAETRRHIFSAPLLYRFGSEQGYDQRHVDVPLILRLASVIFGGVLYSRLFVTMTTVVLYWRSIPTGPKTR